MNFSSKQQRQTNSQFIRAFCNRAILRFFLNYSNITYAKTNNWGVVVLEKEVVWDLSPTVLFYLIFFFHKFYEPRLLQYLNISKTIKNCWNISKYHTWVAKFKINGNWREFPVEDGLAVTYCGITRYASFPWWSCIRRIFLVEMLAWSAFEEGSLWEKFYLTGK